ncbi:VOC family protein [Robiginitalea sp. SC105]|uniref:VOC family protein n=1 Tax=Robiginitalea sp. SC105 TaxID=2762332 RepID=UPI0016396408|nr:VOC family protein [Robiginitalea sp. SC105]MBC2837829.1 VOC family protein [Robiginitalea sp. SC105]
MKKLIPLLVLFFTLSGSGQTSPADLGVAAIGLVVSDIEASDAFYTSVIGMHPTGGFDLDAAWSRDAGAAGGKPFSVRTFKMQETPSATVLKLAYFDSVPERPEQEGVSSYAGVNYITLHYRDLESVLGRVAAAGVPILGEVNTSSYRLVFIRDPDGVFLELVGPPKS